MCSFLDSDIDGHRCTSVLGISLNVGSKKMVGIFAADLLEGGDQAIGILSCAYEWDLTFSELKEPLQSRA